VEVHGFGVGFGVAVGPRGQEWSRRGQLRGS
jgi:hypothetical protein